MGEAYPMIQKFELTQELIDENRGLPIYEGIALDSKEELSIEDSGEEIHYVIKIRGAGDWCIYYSDKAGIDAVCQYGNKLHQYDNILQLVDCTDEVLKKYAH